MNEINPKRLLSHTISPQNMDEVIADTQAWIINQGDSARATVNEQLELLAYLADCKLGRFLLQNKGLNGFWTHYILTHPHNRTAPGFDSSGMPLSPGEQMLLERFPVFLATQARFNIFIKQNQKRVKNGAKLACIPGGMLGELLYLDYTGINNIELIAIDYDPTTLEQIKNHAKEKGLTESLIFNHADAWNVIYHKELDLISSNGLNIYEPDDERVTELYAGFHHALRPGGTLVTSFLSQPPESKHPCDWNMSEINQQDYQCQQILIHDIIQTKWQCFRTQVQTEAQLKTAGFKHIEYHYDPARIFPTVVAQA